MRKTLAALFCATGLISSVQAANVPLATGDVIAVDIGPVTGQINIGGTLYDAVAPNFNGVPFNGSVAAGDVIKYNAPADKATGVSIVSSGMSGQNFDAGDWLGAGGTPAGSVIDPYIKAGAEAAQDQGFGAGDATVTISGLDPNAVFNVRVYAAAGKTETDNIIVTGLAPANQSEVRGTRFLANDLTAAKGVFTNVSPSLAGTIEVKNDSNSWSIMNAVVLEVVSVPALADDFAVVPTNTTTSIDVLANDPATGLSLESVTQGTNGTVAINGSQINYTPNNNYFGADSFTYTADGQTANVSVQVGGTVVTIDDSNAHLLVVSGGDLGKPFVSTTESSIGSNGADSNTWGTGSSSSATGDDIGSTWRTAALLKVGHIVDADGSDALTAAADLANITAMTLRLKQSAVGSANSVDYAPRAVLYGIDENPSNAGGWWGSADFATQTITSSSSFVDGVYDAATNE